MLEGSGRYGLRASWRVVSIEYPADDVFVEAGLSIPDGYASAIIGALFTNSGSEAIGAVPAEGMHLIDTNDARHLAAPAEVEARPGFRAGAVQPEESIAGHLFYLIAKDLGVRGAQWQDGDEKLTWLR
ncbi:hypothetical protein GCM10027298_20490 [Epidermidibacterium keratini]